MLYIHIYIYIVLYYMRSHYIILYHIILSHIISYNIISCSVFFFLNILCYVMSHVMLIICISNIKLYSVGGPSFAANGPPSLALVATAATSLPCGAMLRTSA